MAEQSVPEPVKGQNCQHPEQQARIIGELYSRHLEL